MKHTYRITGMTCDNCKEKITHNLRSIPGIFKVKINREVGLAEISMLDDIQTPVMQEVLTSLGNYFISMKTDISTEQITDEKNYLKDLIPLFIIVVTILLFSVITTLLIEQNFLFGMRMFMGGFFAVFGVLKIWKLKDFAIAYKEYDILAKRSKFYAHTYPFIELALGVLYFINLVPFITNIITIIVMGIGAFGVYRKLLRKEEIPCACLGTVFKVPMTWVTLVEDLLMVIMAIIMILLM
ncbi:MAG: copper chaperone CopZ [Crocinitomicaceae bacterium]|jgi:copper chaperone CopZ